MSESTEPAAESIPSSATSGDPWQSLRHYTNARIAQGRSGGSLPTAPMLAFQLAHAQARDAVHLPFDAYGISESTANLSGLESTEILRVRSAATDRSIYLRRPDLGRQLDDDSRVQLQNIAPPPRRHDIIFVIADGLSALAVHKHALPVFALARQALVAAGWSVAPLILAEQARVALGDEIGELLGADQVAMLIGERPGLSSADSLGVYLTYAPRVGRNDAERNCISNVRPDGGLDYVQAAHKLVWLAREARQRQHTGVALKDDSDQHALLITDTPLDKAIE